MNESTLSDMDQRFLREAIRLAEDNMQHGEGGPFGAVIVLNGAIIGRGWNQVTSANDPTAHAEIVAIRDACRRLERFSLAGCSIYTSCEPCPLCLAAIFWARMDRIVYAATCDDAADAGFDDRVFYDELSKPKGKRSILMQQGLRDDALIPFEIWKRKADRIPY